MGIKKYDRKDRSTKRFGVRWIENGKRSFKFFDSRKKRDSFVAEFEKKVQAEGTPILNLSTADAAVMAECIKKAGSAAAVLRIVEEYSARQVNRIELKEAIQAFVDEKYNTSATDEYPKHIERTMKLFEFDRSAPAHSITPEDARKWFANLKGSPVTVRNHVIRMKVFGKWLAAHGYTNGNVFENLPVPKAPESEPGFLPVDEMRLLMNTAVKFWPDAVVNFALGAFAGLRSSVIVRLEAEKHIRWDQRGLLITGNIAKNKRRQFVDGHEDNLWLWLEWCRQHAPEGFELSKRMWERRREQVAKKAGVVMPHNALRHSFCTYHVALHGDAGKTATLLTHRGNVAILYQHYKGNAGKPDAEKYFSICPAAQRR